MAAATPAIVLVQGDDPKLLADGALAAVAELVGDRDRDEVVAELTGDDYDITAILDGVNTPPFLTDRRIVFARGVDRFTADELKQLVPALTEPLPDVYLVLERATSRARVPKAVTEAIKAGGGEVRSTTVADRGRARADWFDEQLDAAPIRLDRRARDTLVDHLGADIARLESILDMLAATFGSDHTISSADLEPYLGEAGAIPPWELTDPIDAGDVPTALSTLDRMMSTGMHPLQLMAVLHRHVEQALRLDGSGARDDKAAAAILGLTGSTFPAKKALTRARSMGSDVLADHLGLLAAADLDLRGGSGLDGEATMEILVARLADPRRRRSAARR